jgi:hypothetical protein
MYSRDLLNDEGYASKAQKQNRLLIESEELDDGYLRKGGGQLLAPAPQPQRRNPSPLIEEERPEPESQPFLMSHGKANMARQFYDRKQAAKKPWKRGMPYSQATLDMFDSSTPYEKMMFGGVRNPRQAVDLGANRPGGFQKLFGAKMSEDEIDHRNAVGRAPAKSFWGRLKNAVTGGGRKRSWMEMFFGARRRNPGNSAKAMGITSTNAKKGESSGWADQLIEASKAGNLGDGRDGSVMSEELIRPQEEQKPTHQSFEHYIEEEKAPPAPSKQPLLTAKDAKRNSLLGNLYAMQQMQAANKSGQDVNPHQTVDDNSIDESDDDGDGGNGGYDKQMLNNYMYEDDEDGQGGGKPDFINDHIMSLLRKR